MFKKMIKSLSVGVVAMLALAAAGNAHAEDLRAKPIDNPEKFSANIVQMMANNSLKEVATTITETLGRPDVINTFQDSLKIFDGKKFDFSKKVIDHDVNGALRQIIHYSYVKQVGFFYFRFNFKMTSNGWTLANFAFKSETNELFPKDFNPHAKTRAEKFSAPRLLASVP